MQRVPNVRVIMDPITITDDTGTWGTERTHVVVNRWRQTTFGKMNLGWRWMSSPRFVRIK